jgi:hypothetical protein
VVSVAGHIRDLFKKGSREKVEKQFARCIHVVKGPAEKRLVLVRGGKGSRLLDRASLVSEYGKDKNGRRIKVLRKDLEKYFGHFSKHNYLQRSPPRWVQREFRGKAYSYVMKLK